MQFRLPFRLNGWSSVAAVLACLPSCTVDDRQLSTRLDTSQGFFPDGATMPRDAGGIRVRESGVLNYDEDSGRPATVDAGKGPPDVCLHIVDGAPDCANTLALNADFNRDTAEWAAGGFAEIRWVGKDSQGAKGSGSIAVTNTNTMDLDGQGEVAATQCLEVVPQQTYDYRAAAYILRGQVDYGTAQIGVWFFERPKCQAPVQVGGAYAMASVQATNAWLPMAGSLRPVPESKSMAFRLIAVKPYRSGPFEVLFDAVRITSRPSPQP